MLTIDTFFDIIERSDLKTIQALCQTNAMFYNLCKTYPKQIQRIKCKGLNQTISDNESNMRMFAKQKKLIFDKKSRDVCLSVSSMGTFYDKIWVDLMFLLNKKYFAEAEALIVCSKLPEPPMGLFDTKEMVEMPAKLMNLLWEHLPPILEVSGYDNIEDFKEDYPLRDFKNKTLRNIVKAQIYFK